MSRRARIGLVVAFVPAAMVGCTHVRPWQRERLASPAMQYEMAPTATAQTESILEITEGNTYPGVGPGNAGAGCGCH